MILSPCAHVVCKKCFEANKKCPQCPKAVKDKLGPSDFVAELVNKYEITRDAINTFKN